MGEQIGTNNVSVKKGARVTSDNQLPRQVPQCTGKKRGKK